MTEDDKATDIRIKTIEEVTWVRLTERIDEALNRPAFPEHPDQLHFDYETD